MLDQLRDIHLPASPAWWPPAWPWWLLAALVLVVTVFAAQRLAQTLRRRRPRRAAQRLAQRIQRRYREDGDAGAACRALSVVLRRYLVLHEPSAAALSGDAFRRYLSARLPGGMDDDALAALDDPYRREGGDVERMARLVQRLLAVRRFP